MATFHFSLIVLISLVVTLSGVYAADFNSKYPFKRVLLDDQGQTYELYWNYSIAAETIHFAVNVSTTGWVGFGLSPNGQMPGSDVVIGWIAADGSEHFHVRSDYTALLEGLCGYNTMIKCVSTYESTLKLLKLLSSLALSSNLKLYIPAYFCDHA